MLAFGDVCGDYRLMKHSHEGISTSRRMPGEMLGSYKPSCVCCLQLNIYSKYTVQMQPHPNGFSLVTSVVRVWYRLFSVHNKKFIVVFLWYGLDYSSKSFPCPHEILKLSGLTRTPNYCGEGSEARILQMWKQFTFQRALRCMCILTL